MATRNRCETLQRCLQEYSDQSFRDFEIIVADNGSTDDTLTKLPTLFPHVTFVDMGRQAGPLALNRAAEVAQGEYLWRTDDDAYPHDESTLGNGVKFLDENPSVVAITGSVYEATIGFKPLDYYPFNIPNEWDPNVGLPTNEFYGVAAMIRRKEFLEAGGFWDMFYLEELDVSTRLIAAGGKIMYTTVIGVFHLSAFSQHRRINERWLLQATQTIRYQWKYFSFIRALYRSLVVFIAMTISAVFHKFPIATYLNGVREMYRAARKARRFERTRFSRRQLNMITMGRSIWSYMFRYYVVRWKSRKHK